MSQVLGTLITALSAILIAVIQVKGARDKKRNDELAKREKEEAEKVAKIRARESRLSIDMMYATAKLCMGTALAVKRGKANGELEDGLEIVDRAMEKYEDFLKDVASDRIGR